MKIFKYLISRHFALLTDNLCDNALDLANGILNVEANWPDRTYCQWMISAQDNDGYVTLEFQSFNVNSFGYQSIKIIAFNK